MGILQFIFFTLLVLFSPIILWATWVILYILFGYIYNVKIKKYPIKHIDSSYLIKEKRKSIFHRLFIEFPKRFLQDRLEYDPYDFKEFGLHLFVGSQGSGKTISVVEHLIANKKRYPKSKVITNFNYMYQDGILKDWKNLLNYNNGNFGVFKVIDEIQTWFSSKESGQMPFELLGEISQQRKQRSCIIGTAQVFSRVIKEIREQTTYVYCPRTFFGCLTIVRRTTPNHWDNEKQVFKHYDKMYFFVHTNEIRNAFDTYKKIERLQKSGFNERRIESTIEVINKT